MAERALTDAEVDSELEKLEASMRQNGLLGGWAGPCRRALHDLREARRNGRAAITAARVFKEERDDARARLRLHAVYVHETHHLKYAPSASLADCLLCADDRRALGDA